MAVNHEELSGPNATPPYISWRTFWTFIEELRSRGSAPQVVDNTVLGTHRSGGARSQLLVALRFFGLIDGDKRATTTLDELVQGPDPERLTRALIEARFSDVIALDLRTATVNQVDKALSDMGAGSGDTLRKTRQFFLNALEFADIEIGPFLKKAVAPSSAPRRKAKKSPPKPSAGEDQPPPPPPDAGMHPFIQGLLRELPKHGDSWTAERRDQWLGMAKLTVEMLFPVEGP